MAKDPTKISVPFNVMIPWDFREFMRDKADREGVSQNSLYVDALMKTYGNEFVMQQAKAPR